MEKEIRKIIEKSELYYTSGKLIDSESFNMMIDELVSDLLELKQDGSKLWTRYWRNKVEELKNKLEN